MRPRLLEFLHCPSCYGGLQVQSFKKSPDGQEVVEGVLTCECGTSYPIVNTIPRILENARQVFPNFYARYGLHAGEAATAGRHEFDAEKNQAIAKTRESFGYQWTLFSNMVINFRDNFLHYIHPIDESFFLGKVGLDVGCGFGRHIYNAATFGAEMVGVDISAAIDVTRRNTQHLPNVHLVQADLYRLPFREKSFDFAYSIGVLHHLPEPEAGFQCIIPVVKVGGAVFIWVYSKRRPVVNLLINCARLVTTRFPRTVQKFVSFIGATVDWAGFIVPYRVASSLPVMGPFVKRVAFQRLKVYSAYPFQVVWADWFDRLAAPIRFYYDSQDLDGWLSRAKLNRTMISPTGLFGWRAYGERL